MSALVRATRTPAITDLAPAVARARLERQDLVDLGQAVPHFPPPRAALDEVVRALDGVEPHRYTADEGDWELRVRWAGVLRERLGLKVDPARHLLVTAGANQAYLAAAMTLIGPGERMGIVSPWYFNHAMAIEMIGGALVELPLSPEEGYQLDPDRLVAEAVRHRLKALTVVSPGNPTGVTYPPAALRRLTEGLRAAGIFLVVDETYAFFADDEVGHLSPGALEEQPDLVLTIGSFSKTFAMTGWRVGYLVASEEIVREALKVHDTMAICASHPGQLLVKACLGTAWEWLGERRAELGARLRAVRAAAPSLSPWTVASAGPFFALLRGPERGRDVARELLERDGVVVVPGEAFGSGLEGALRLSLGGASEAALREGLRRMSRRFAERRR